MQQESDIKMPFVVQQQIEVNIHIKVNYIVAGH